MPITSSIKIKRIQSAKQLCCIWFFEIHRLEMYFILWNSIDFPDILLLWKTKIHSISFQQGPVHVHAISMFWILAFFPMIHIIIFFSCLPQKGIELRNTISQFSGNTSFNFVLGFCVLLNKNNLARYYLPQIVYLSHPHISIILLNPVKHFCRKFKFSLKKEYCINMYCVLSKNFV